MGDVHVIGGEENVKGTQIPKYWKNGVSTIISGESSTTALSAIDVLGDDVYIAGYGTISGTINLRYWKNGVLQNLTDGSYYAAPSAIKVR